MRIGIDTGGTYTDAVLFDDSPGVDQVVATAKARTRRDLSIGIAQAVDQLLATGVAADQISLVSLSTTLATNALVEGVGGRIALVFIGFDEADLDRGGLRSALEGAPVLQADGGHDSLGAERQPFDPEALARRAAQLDVEAFAVTGQFSVRNPSHELAAAEVLAGLGKPVVCGHELSARLNGPKRALTCVLNAKLIGLITELCSVARAMLADRGIEAPLMVVKGDGSLVSAEFINRRPIETILSGPAASMIGASWLTGADDLVVADIGGTTTDVGILARGRPAVAADGATVGGHRTMVEAVDMLTVGLGGDSEVTLDLRASPARVELGPRRVTPLAVLATDHPELVHNTLDARGFPFRPGDLTFIRAVDAVGSADVIAASPGGHQAEVLQALSDHGRAQADGWAPMDRVATSSLAGSALRALVAGGRVEVAAFTPTDAAHVLGLMDDGDRSASITAAELLAAAPDTGGSAVRPDAEALARWVVDTVIHRSAEAILRTTLRADGLPDSLVNGPLIQRVINDRTGQTSISVGPTSPLAALGASAATYYPTVGSILGVDCTVPEHAEVANAIGAAVGRVRVMRQVTVSQPSRGQFRVHHPAAGPDLGNLEPAIDQALDLLASQVLGEADTAGATAIEIETDVERRTAMVNGKELFVEATVTAVASGPPKPA